MATKTTGWKCVHSASIVSETNTNATIRVTCYWQNDGWNYDISNVSAWTYCNDSSHKVKDSGSVDAPSNSGKYSMGYHDFTISKGTSKKSVSCYAKITSNSTYVSGTKSSSATSVSVPAKPSYTITYNANGGTGSPSNQTKWYGTNLTLSSTKPTRTGYSFSGWATSASGNVAYQPGATYSSNSAVTLYAIWIPNTYNITYDANGGSGAPGNQTKTHDVNLTLSSSVPTRTNYNFLGWSTSSNGGVVYNPGDVYTNNNAVTLYAIWELAYIDPRITNFEVERCNSDGTTNESGTYVKTSFDWATDKTVSEIKIEWKTTETDSTWSNTTVTASGTSGYVNQIVGEGSISNETSYIFRAYVSDGSGYTYSPQLSVGTPKYPIDVKKGGTGVAFGKAAEEENVCDIAFETKLSGGLRPVFLEAETDLNEVKTPNFYTGENISTNNYSNCPLESGTFYLEVVSCGDEGQIRQTITNCSKVNPITYVRYFYQETWGSWKTDWETLASGTDLDSLLIPANYVIFSSNTYTNAPKDNIGATLEILGREYLIQRFTIMSKTEPAIYERSYFNNAWGEWICICNFSNKLLWADVKYMDDTQTATLLEPVSKQPTGIVLVFSGYSSGAAANNNFSCYFIPKIFVSKHNGNGHFIPLGSTGGLTSFKYLYVKDTAITGNAKNVGDVAGTFGTYKNSNFVLRYVIGV